jgi:alkanesulfonate monooxygenase SsuD/methylene tetrahydromethanopterin reductase-like flavin-dependent oxidoreductase (luciferase family)
MEAALGLTSANPIVHPSSRKPECACVYCVRKHEHWSGQESEAMRFHYAEAMTNPANYIPLAQAAETAGFFGFVIPDSLIYPKASATSYSYTDDGGREFLENKPFIETFTLAMAMGVATTRLHFTPNVLKMTVRPPLYTAKIASSIAVMTNNRFSLGAGLSVWPEDYQAMGVAWEKRGERFDECIEIFQGLTAGGYFEFHGKF